MKVKELILYTPNMEEQRTFYHKTLGFPLLVNSNEKISFQTGESTLSFLKRNTAVPGHFAFNIPPYTEQYALEWLKQRVELLPFENNDIIDFLGWNARALYFYDADKNIVEFIARRNLEIKEETGFSIESVINISEVGIATTDNERVYNALNLTKKLPVYDGSFARFCAAGNEEGLFILVNKNEKKWFPTGDEALFTDLEVRGDYNFIYKNGKIIIQK